MYYINNDTTACRGFVLAFAPGLQRDPKMVDCPAELSDFTYGWLLVLWIMIVCSWLCIGCQYIATADGDGSSKGKGKK
jgi:hypothetical protein